MPRFAALLRGINVGRGKRLPMAELRELLESLGWSEVRTLLNSGNAVFQCAGRSSRAQAGVLRAALDQRFELDVPVVVKSAREFEDIACGNELLPVASDLSRLLVIFSQDAKGLAALDMVAKLTSGAERFHRGPHAAYLWCPRGILESKAAEALLVQKHITTRNWATFEKIRALLGEERA